MYEMKIRGLSEATLTYLDDLAKKRNTTRNQVVKEILQLAADNDVLEEQRRQYEMLIEDLAIIIDTNTAVLSALYQKLDGLQAMEIDDKIQRGKFATFLEKGDKNG